MASSYVLDNLTDARDEIDDRIAPVEAEIDARVAASTASRSGYKHPILPVAMPPTSAAPSPEPVNRRADGQWARWALHPAYAVAVTLLLALVGLLGSVFTADIKGAFPFGWAWPTIGWSWTATLFWLTLTLTATLFWQQRRAESNAQARTRKDLEARTDALKDAQENAQMLAEKLLAEQALLRDAQESARTLTKKLLEEQACLRDAQAAATALSEQLREEQKTDFETIRSMPPDGFLRQFMYLYAAAESATTQILLDPEACRDDARVRETLHLVLVCYARLAHFFDDSPSEAYSANIMLFHESTNLDQDQRTRVKSRLSFCDETTAVGNLRGVLDLRRDLAVRYDPHADTASPAASSIDVDLKPFALPVPKRTTTSKVLTTKRSLLLPGAPLAFAERRADFYADMDQMLAWCREHGDFTADVLADVHEYFRVDAPPYIGSLASAPLPLVDVNPETPPLGVVNLHRRSRGLLKDRKRSADTFTQVSSPLLHLLHRLLLVLQAAEQDRYDGWCNLLPPDSTAS